MDSGTIGVFGLVLAGIGLVAGFLYWLRPRATTGSKDNSDSVATGHVIKDVNSISAIGGDVVVGDKHVLGGTRDRDGDEPRVMVTVSQGQASFVFGSTTGPTHSAEDVVVRVTNVGAVPVSVEQVVFVTSKKRDYPLTHGDGANLPRRLTQAGSLAAWDGVMTVLDDMRAHDDYVVAAVARGAGGYEWKAEELGPCMHMGKRPLGATASNVAQ